MRSSEFGLVQSLVHARHRQHPIGGIRQLLMQDRVAGGAALLEGEHAVDEVQAVAHPMIDLAHHEILGGEQTVLLGQADLAYPDRMIDRMRRDHDQDADQRTRRAEAHQHQAREDLLAGEPLLEQCVLVATQLRDVAGDAAGIGGQRQRPGGLDLSGLTQRKDPFDLREMLVGQRRQRADAAQLDGVVPGELLDGPDALGDVSAKTPEPRQLIGVAVQGEAAHGVLDQQQVPDDPVDLHLDVARVADPVAGLPRLPRHRGAQRETEHGERQDADQRPRGAPPDDPAGRRQPQGGDVGCRACRHEATAPSMVRGCSMRITPRVRLP